MCTHVGTHQYDSHSFEYEFLEITDDTDSNKVYSRKKNTVINKAQFTCSLDKKNLKRKFSRLVDNRW